VVLQDASLVAAVEQDIQNDMKAAMSRGQLFGAGSAGAGWDAIAKRDPANAMQWVNLATQGMTSGTLSCTHSLHLSIHPRGYFPFTVRPTWSVLRPFSCCTHLDLHRIAALLQQSCTIAKHALVYLCAAD